MSTTHDTRESTARDASPSAGCCGGSKKQSSGGCCKETGSRESSGGCCGGGGSVARGAMAVDLTRPIATPDEMAAMPTLHLIMRYRRGVQNLDNRVLQLSERQIDQAFLPDAGVGQWPVRVLLGHLADAELFACGRMRRIIGEDGPTVEMWDENAFVDANVYQNADKAYAEDEESDHARVMAAVGGHMAVIHTLRQWTGQWLMTLDESAWERTLMHPMLGAMSLRKVVAYMTWHVEHHAKFLTLKLDRMLGQQVAGKGSAGCECGESCDCGPECDC